MEYRKESRGMLTFIEHMGLFSLAMIVSVGCQLMFALLRLRDDAWLAGCACGIALQVAGAVLIGYSKLPAYRNGRFFTFGVKSVPAPLARYYRWGWRMFLGGAVLSIMLLVSGP